MLGTLPEGSLPPVAEVGNQRGPAVVGILAAELVPGMPAAAAAVGIQLVGIQQVPAAAVGSPPGCMMGVRHRQREVGVRCSSASFSCVF